MGNKTFIYQGGSFQLLVEAATKEKAIAKMIEVLHVQTIDERFVFQGIFRATKI
jgi:hypothetical protein